MTSSSARKTRLRATYVTQWFDPESVPKGANYVRELGINGFDVHVVTAFPSYPLGKTFEGYRQRPWMDDQSFGFSVRRVAAYPSHDSSIVRRVLSFVTFCSSAFVQLLFQRPKPDVYLAYHPPISTGLVVAVTARMRSVPFVLDVQDLWPESLNASGFSTNRFIRKLVQVAVNVCYSDAEQIITGSDGLAYLIASQLHNDDAGKVHTVFNWCDEKSLLNGTGVDRADTGFTLLFAGNLGFAQDLDTVLDAAKILSSAEVEVTIRLLGAGARVEHLKKRISEEHILNVTLPGLVSPQEAGVELRRADALLVTLNDDPLFQKTIPSKCQAYLAAGRPIIISVGGDAEQLVVADAQAGIASIPGNPFALANAIREMVNLSSEERNKMGARGANFYRNHLALQHGAKKTADILRKASGVHHL